MNGAGWIETYRGTVKAWECDMVEHLTVAYYYERMIDAVFNLLDEVGAGPAHVLADRRTLAAVAATTARYERELRGGDLHHIESGFIGCGEHGARAGHKLFDSASGELCAAFTVSLRYVDLEARRTLPMPAALRRAIEARIVEWDRPPPEPRPAPKDESAFFDTGRDTVKPWEIDLLGHLSAPFYIHRFSDALMHAIARFGMTPAYLRENRIGFSTFEFQGRFRRELRAGDRSVVRSALMHVGGSSIRVLHRMYHARTGELAAELSQYGVHLDMDARRPSRLPEEMRARAAALLSGGQGRDRPPAGAVGERETVSFHTSETEDAGQAGTGAEADAGAGAAEAAREEAPKT